MARDSRSGFTLIEIIIVLVIMATLVGTAVLSVVSGLRNASQREAVRTTMGYIRHARAVALVKQRPVALTFEELADDVSGGFAKSRITLAFSGDAGSEEDALAVAPKDFPGIHVRTNPKEEVRVNKISVFSNADALRKLRAKTSAEAEKKSETTDKDGAASDGTAAEDDSLETSSALIEANGQCEPYVVKIWKDGADEDDAVLIDVSKFAKPVVRDEKEGKRR